jgi:hypothetical protein
MKTFTLRNSRNLKEEKIKKNLNNEKKKIVKK